MRASAQGARLVGRRMHPLRDQPVVGRRVEAAGAGRTVKKGASAEQLRPVIAAMLADGPHRTAAARLGALIRESRGTATAADRILEVVPNGARPASRLG